MWELSLEIIVGPLIGTLVGSFLGFISARYLNNEQRRKDAEVKLRYLIDEYSELLIYSENVDRKERMSVERMLRSEIKHTQISSGIKKQDFISEMDKMLRNGRDATIYASLGTGTSNKEVMNGLTDKKFYDDCPKIKEFMYKTERIMCKRSQTEKGYEKQPPEEKTDDVSAHDEDKSGTKTDDSKKT